MMIHLVDRFEGSSRIYKTIDRFFSRLTPWLVVQPTSNNDTSESVDSLRLQIDELNSRIENLTNRLNDVNKTLNELKAAYEYEKARNLEYENVSNAQNDRVSVANINDTSILGIYASLE